MFKQMIAGASLAVLLTMTGCASVAGLQAGEGEPGNQVQISGKTYDQVWAAAVHAVTSSTALNVVSSEKQKGEIRAEKPGSLGLLTSDYGVNVAVFILPAKPGAAVYTVEVQSMQKSGMQQFGRQDFAPGIVANIKADLNI